MLKVDGSIIRGWESFPLIKTKGRIPATKMKGNNISQIKLFVSRFKYSKRFFVRAQK